MFEKMSNFYSLWTEFHQNKQDKYLPPFFKYKKRLFLIKFNWNFLFQTIHKMSKWHSNSKTKNWFFEHWIPIFSFYRQSQNAQSDWFCAVTPHLYSQFIKFAMQVDKDKGVLQFSCISEMSTIDQADTSEVSLLQTYANL